MFSALVVERWVTFVTPRKSSDSDMKFHCFKRWCDWAFRGKRTQNNKSQGKNRQTQWWRSASIKRPVLIVFYVSPIPAHPDSHRSTTFSVCTASTVFYGRPMVQHSPSALSVAQQKLRKIMYTDKTIFQRVMSQSGQGHLQSEDSMHCFAKVLGVE